MLSLREIEPSVLEPVVLFLGHCPCNCLLNSFHICGLIAGKLSFKEAKL
jgi:hypothetical protein